MSQWQTWGPAIVIIAGYLLGFYFQHRDIERLERRLNQRIDDLRLDLNKRIDDFRSEINHRFDDLKDWIRSEVKRLEERIERLEHPVSRQP
jgi:archaellum component FlaC